jgi:hypothetical protein
MLQYLLLLPLDIDKEEIIVDHYWNLEPYGCLLS